ncbi:MAG: substrate-binding domain-containing protein [Nitriliruptorales bacterium]|nr:substrate-binding domain-containing protein [Nitriliruptorales bacterium]
MGKPITLRDVAEQASVHPSTASRALNSRTRDMVNPATVARVLEVARELGYQPNSLARGLKMNQTFTVGMLVPDLTNPLFPPIVRGIEDRLNEQGYTLVLANTDNDDGKERAIISAMGTRRVDGLILATARREYPLLDEILAGDLRVVLVNRAVDNPAVPSVVGDDHAGVGFAVRHLVELGHRRIAHVAGTQAVTTGLARYQSFVSWMQSLDLELDRDLVVFADWFQEQSGARAFAELLDRGRDFTAVVAANDLIALGCYDVLTERGLRVPEDVSVIGYNDIPFSDKFNPPLTTIRIPHYAMGVRGAELLLEAIDDPDATPVSMRLSPSLVIRASTAPPRR